MRILFLIIWWIWVCEERASGWPVPCLSQFQGWKIPILIGDLERSLRYLKEIQWSHYLQFQSIESSWKSQYHLVLPFISSFLTIFQLYGVRCTWWDIHFFWGSLSWSSILYSEINALYLNFINISILKASISHVLLSNIEQTMPFPQYIVVNSCNLDGIEYMCETLMIYK